MRWLLLLALAASACATSYQPHGFSGGYSELQLSERVYDVSFSGNGYCSASYVRRMTLRRAAELALLRRFTHFVPIDATSDVSVSSTPLNCFSGRCYGGNVISKPGSSMRVLLLSREDAATVPLAVDARLFLQQFEDGLAAVPLAPPPPTSPRLLPGEPPDPPPAPTGPPY